MPTENSLLWQTLFLDYLKPDALTFAASEGMALDLPQWLQRQPLATVGPGTMDGLLLSAKNAPRNLIEVLAKVDGLAPGGILIFPWPERADFQPADLRECGLILRARSRGLTVVEKERQLSHTSGMRVSLLFMASATLPADPVGSAPAQTTTAYEKEPGWPAVKESLRIWDAFVEQNFLPGVCECILVNDQGLSNADQHELQALKLQSVRLVHHFRRSGYQAALRTGFARAGGKYVFHPGPELQPEHSWPFWRALLIPDEFDFLDICEPQVPRSLSRSRRTLHPVSLGSEQAFALSSRQALELCRLQPGRMPDWEKFLSRLPARESIAIAG